MVMYIELETRKTGFILGIQRFYYFVNAKLPSVV